MSINKNNFKVIINSFIASIFLVACNSGTMNNSNASSGAQFANKSYKEDTQQILTKAEVLYSSSGSVVNGLSDSFNANLYSIAKGNGVYIAVGDAGQILYSTDGYSWTKANSGVSVNLHAIAYNSTNSLFYVVGDNSTVLSSADGKSWTLYKTLNPVVNLYSVLDVQGNLVVGASMSTIFEIKAAGRGTVSVRNTVDNMKLISATYGNGMMLLGSDDGSILYKSAANFDTAVWYRATKFAGMAINGLSYDALDRWFIAAGSNGKVIFSENSIAWTTPVVAADGYSLNSIVLDNISNQFISVGGTAASSTMVASGDFNAWSQQTLPVNNAPLNSIQCFDQGDCFVVGNSATILVGKKRNQPASLPIWEQVTGNQLVVASGASYTNQSGTQDVVLFKNASRTFILQKDSNLVCYGTKGPLWASTTNWYTSPTPGSMQMLLNGNLQVKGDYRTYSSDTNSQGAYIIYKSDDNSIDIVSADGKTVLQKLC